MPRSSIYEPDEFLLRMKKKPALQAIIDNLDSYTSDQLQNISGQPLWIRDALVKLKARGGLGQKDYIMANTHFGHNPYDNNSYEVREWFAMEQFFALGKTNVETALEPGQLIMLKPHNVVRLDFIEHTVSQKVYDAIVNGSRYIDTMTLTQYRAAIQDRAIKKL